MYESSIEILNIFGRIFRACLIEFCHTDCFSYIPDHEGGDLASQIKWIVA